MKKMVHISYNLRWQAPWKWSIWMLYHVYLGMVDTIYFRDFSIRYNTSFLQHGSKKIGIALVRH